MISAEIRWVKTTDAREALSVYAPYVQHTAVSFEYEVPTLTAYEENISAITAEYPWLVCCINNQVIGFAYAGTFRTRPAYKWSVESTIYLEKQWQSLGIGKLLYQTLIHLLKMQGFVNVFAGVAIPNPGSEQLHLSVGFREAGIFNHIGYKNGSWHTTKWYQLLLQPLTANPSLPLPVKQVYLSREANELIKKTNDRLSLLVNKKQKHD